MAANRIEVRHNEPAQVREYVREALEVLEELVPAPLITAEVLCKVIDLLAAKSIHETHPAPQPVMLGMPRMDIPGGGRH